MPSKQVSFDNSTPGFKLFPRNPKRIAFSIYVPSTEDAVSINDDQFTPGGASVMVLNPGELATFSVFEGDDCTKPWYIISETAGTNNAFLLEQVLIPSIDQKLRQVVETAQGWFI